MNMYLHELMSLRKSTIIWTCTMIAVAALYFSIYPSIAADAADFTQLLSGYPAPVRAALGISLNNITSLLGFYSMVFSLITLCGAIQAMNFGVSILSREVRERTADFLLVKPVSRPAIVSAKLLAAVTMLLSTNVFYYAAAFMLASIVKNEDYSVKLFLLINLTLFFIQMMFLAIGVLISVFFIKLKSVLPISLGSVFGFYIMGALIATGTNDMERFISPFKYFDISYIMKYASFDTPYLLTGAAIVVVAISLSYAIYSKKDIQPVS
ncbi:MAG: ABC transporter permease subunit [Bacillota bacterium]|nr:ABC transporter permease subunit [Bacillota bacterium]